MSVCMQFLYALPNFLQKKPSPCKQSMAPQKWLFSHFWLLPPCIYTNPPLPSNKFFFSFVFCVVCACDVHMCGTWPFNKVIY